jgi:hypothetical protein
MTTKKSSTQPTSSTPTSVPSNPSPATSAASPPAAPASPATPAASPPIITSVSSTKVAAEVSYQTLVAGLPTVFPGQTQFVLPSGTYTLDELLAPFQKRIAMAEATKAADTQYHAAVAAEQAVVEVTEPLRGEVKQLAVARFGKKSSALAQLGFPPGKPRVVSAATKAASAAKAAATRKAKKAAAAAAGTTATPSPAATTQSPVTPPPAPKPGS